MTQRGMGIAGAAVWALLALGCTGEADPAPEATAAPAGSETGTQSATPSPLPSPTADATDEEPTEDDVVASPDPTPAASGGRGSASPEASTRSLAIEQRHPNGSILRLMSLTIEPTAIRVTLEVVNGSERDLELAGANSVVSLTDDVGGVYEFLRPGTNPDLLIPPRGTLTGELVYFGVLNPEATTLRLQSTSQTSDPARVFDPATERPNETFPHFSVEIPLDS